MLQTRIMQRATSYARPRSLILWNLKGYPDKWGRGSMPKYIFFPVYQGGRKKQQCYIGKQQLRKNIRCVSGNCKAFSDGVKVF